MLHHGESPWSMAAPLVVLAVPAVVSGFVNVPWAEVFGRFLETTTVHETLGEHHAPFSPVIALVSVIVALAGIWLAWSMYGSKTLSLTFDRRLHGFLYNKYYLDFLYEQILVRGLLYSGIAQGLALFDRYVVDGAVNGVGRLTSGFGQAMRRVETGQVQAYGLAIFLGVVVITAGMMLRG